MAQVKMKAAFSCPVEKVWDIVTSMEDYHWRSDLDHISIQNERQFTEHTKDGYETAFTVTNCEKYKRWEFDMENGNMTGHWIGTFSRQHETTEIEFTENVTAKKFWMKPLVGIYLKKQQEAYLADLRKALNE